MARIAEWHPIPADVRSPWCRLFERVRNLHWSFWPVLLVLVVFFGLQIVPGVGSDLLKSILGSLNIVIVPLATYLVVQVLRRPPSEILVRMDEPHHFPQCGAKVLLIENDFEYGSDLGVVTVCGGWLHFEGLQTQFSLKAENVTSLNGHLLSLVVNGCPVKATLVLFGVGAREKGALEFEAALKQWHADCIEVEGEPLLPPRQVKPGLRQGRRAETLSWFAAAIAFALACWLFVYVRPIVIPIGCSVASLGSLVMGVRALQIQLGLAAVDRDLRARCALPRGDVTPSFQDLARASEALSDVPALHEVKN